ncbi:hypothetical protein BS78_08G170200 [Paspalum vaginatum]|nr:hypothetical protein BS78_08G170200 [Paspalum vaginatum]
MFAPRRLHSPSCTALTVVNSGTELRKLFIEITSRSIIAIEDIDCSIHLIGKRKKKKSHGKNCRTMTRTTRSRSPAWSTSSTSSGRLVETTSSSATFGSC